MAGFGAATPRPEILWRCSGRVASPMLREPEWCCQMIIVALAPDARLLMKRDMELIRKILLEIESWPDVLPHQIEIENVDKATLHRHIEYLYQAGFIEGHGHRSSMDHRGADHFPITDMSWEGQEFLASIRNDGVWNKIKGSFSPADLAGLPLSILKDVGIDLLKDWAKKQVGL